MFISQGLVDQLFKETIENSFNYKEIAYEARKNHGVATKPEKQTDYRWTIYKQENFTEKKTDPARIRTQDRCNSTRDSLLYANPLKNLRSLIFFNSSYRMIQVICETSSQPERSLYSTEAQSRKSTYDDSFDCTLDLNGKQMSISEKKQGQNI